jgi:hypothetical protein
MFGFVRTGKLVDKFRMDCLASIDIPVKETEPKHTNKEEFNSKKSESDSLPKINDASSVDTCNQSKKGISVSLQTDDYLYYNTDDNPRPTTTSQGNRRVGLRYMFGFVRTGKLVDKFRMDCFDASRVAFSYTALCPARKLGKPLLLGASRDVNDFFLCTFGNFLFIVGDIIFSG